MKKKIWTIFLAICVISFLGRCAGALVGGNSRKEKENEVVVQTDISEEEAEEDTEEVTEEEKEEKEEKEEPSTEKKKEKKKEKKSQKSNIDPDFKEAMDSYEAFFDEYVDFMEEYSESGGSMDMLLEYTEYMTKYADFMEKMDAIDEDELNEAELAYYIDVTARIQKKLLSVTQ